MKIVNLFHLMRYLHEICHKLLSKATVQSPKKFALFRSDHPFVHMNSDNSTASI